MTARKSSDWPVLWMGLRRSTEGTPYRDVRDTLAAHIHSDAIAANVRLPSERDLQTEMGAARGTVRAALLQLETEGLIYRKERSGWYVSPAPIVYDPTRWEGFMAYVAGQGRSPRTECLSARVVAAAAECPAVFGVASGAPLYELRRRRYIDERQVLVETIFADPRLVPDLLDHDLEGSLTQVLRNHYGIGVARNRIEMQPCALPEEAALALRVRAGLPGLRVTRISEDAHGRVVEYDQEYWRHDAVKIHVDIHVTSGG